MKILKIPKVQCDLCGENLFNNIEEGGMLFNDKLICPRCLPDFKKLIKEYKEEHYIRAVAIKGETFHRFAMRVKYYHYEILN